MLNGTTNTSIIGNKPCLISNLPIINIFLFQHPMHKTKMNFLDVLYLDIRQHQSVSWKHVQAQMSMGFVIILPSILTQTLGYPSQKYVLDCIIKIFSISIHHLQLATYHLCHKLWTGTLFCPQEFDLNTKIFETNYLYEAFETVSAVVISMRWVIMCCTKYEYYGNFIF